MSADLPPSSACDSLRNDCQPATIRLLGPNDVAIFRALRMTMLQDTPGAFGASMQDEAVLSEAAWAARVGPDDHSAVFGAFIGGHLVGSIALSRQRPLKVRHKALIWGVFVASSARGQGLARRLMQAMIAHASTLPDLRQVTLSVAAWNTKASELYRSLGFVQYGREPEALCVDGEWLDECLMMLRLSCAKRCPA